MPIITCNIREPPLWKILSIKSISLSLISLRGGGGGGKVVYNVEKSYVDRFAAQKPRNFNLFVTSREFLIDQKDFYRTFHRLHSNFDSSVVVHELELAINRALYGFCVV